MSEDLKKKAEELEQTLLAQLNLAKQESEDWAKVGGVVLGAGVLGFVLVRLMTGKKNKKTKKVLETLEREGLLDKELENKLTRKNEPGFMGRLGAILLPIAVNYGKEQLMNRLQNQSPKEESDEIE